MDADFKYTHDQQYSEINHCVSTLGSALLYSTVESRLMGDRKAWQQRLRCYYAR